MLALVRASSVRSGRTSLIAPTSVVLPAPNPPAMRILNEARGTSAAPLEGAKAMQYLLKQVVARLLADASLRQYDDGALLDEVGEQDADHADGQPSFRGHIDYGGLPTAYVEDLAVLRTETHQEIHSRIR